jgi:hypothetical protein
MFGHYIKKAWMQKLDLNWPLPFIDASINLGLKGYFSPHQAIGT